MKERMVPAQQLSDAGEDLVRLAAAKDAEIAELKADFRTMMIASKQANDNYIAALTEQRDRAMKALRACCNQGYNLPLLASETLTALDAETAAETAPSLPETP